MLTVEANINDWRVNGNNLNLNLVNCTDYEGSTPSTVISVFNEWPEAHPYHNTGNMEVVSTYNLCSKNLLNSPLIYTSQLWLWNQIAVKNVFETTNQLKKAAVNQNNILVQNMVTRHVGQTVS